VAVGVQQDVPGPFSRARDRRTQRGLPRGGRARRHPRLSHRAGSRRPGHTARLRRARRGPGGSLIHMAPRELRVYLVRGDDPVLTGAAVPACAVEDLAGDDYELAAAVEAAQTPPFFGDRRVVVARPVGRFSAQDVAPLISYLADPLSTTALVLVGGGGQIARGLLDAVKKSGHVIDG